MVEQLTLNQRVVGSSPTRFTISLINSTFRSHLTEVGHNWAQNLSALFRCATPRFAYSVRVSVQCCLKIGVAENRLSGLQ